MNTALPLEVITAMATRAQRMHHYLWHEVRNNWLLYPPNTQQQIAAIGWQPPRPARDENGNVILDNNSGEDFLYMHRQMIAFVNNILAQVANPDYPKVEGWAQIPAPGDPDFPVPPAWDESVQQVKSDAFYNNPLKVWEQTYTDPKFLQRVTLAELGARIETTIHNAMHMRWASAPAAIRPDADPTQPDGTISTTWDDPGYNYLGDTYSSHVHPIFWKLHGWVDNRINDWQAANGFSGEPNWTGTWMGNMSMAPMPMGNMLMAPMSMDTMPATRLNTTDNAQEMEQVAKIIIQSGIFLKPFQLVDVPTPELTR